MTAPVDRRQRQAAAAQVQERVSRHALARPVARMRGAG
jgi:hypothetical protein